MSESIFVGIDVSGRPLADLVARSAGCQLSASSKLSLASKTKKLKSLPSPAVNAHPQEIGGKKRQKAAKPCRFQDAEIS